eukprot:CAMPEP_0197028788 /NCGR_PEP_ID=MMETSP1384-20130603/8396_1 /TAXON_ID=29189 /ORGANISM="Ammonia sp." /LENGTH=324 /DNA_ID=CAMNT_0042457845 /DNA_START=423 /DNA_END=1397 /DNA_ORIENTATION=-
MAEVEEAEAGATSTSTTNEKQETVAISEADVERTKQILAKRQENSEVKRIYAGMKRSEILQYKPTAISEKDGLYGISEYIVEVIKDDYTNIERIIEIPKDLSQQSGGNDARLQFQVEMMKYFLIEVGFFVVFLSVQCNNTNCNKMQATSKFRYRCSAHRKPKDCNAIQYCVHTLDLFTERLNHKDYNICSPTFSKIPEKKAKKDIGDLCRRVYRIFAHAFFHHQQLFDKYESKHLLCTRFISFFKKYQLVPAALFKREIQIPAASLYFNRQQRKEKLRQYFIRQQQLDKQQRTELANARRHASLSQDDFMKNSAVAELDSDEIY